MRKAFIAIGLLVLCSAAVSASPSPELASFLDSLGASGSCPNPIQTASKGGGSGGITAFGYCEANCSPYSKVSCSGGTCSSVDRNCSAGQRGYVQCDGVTTYCPVCPTPGCNEGWVEYRDGGCCQGGYQKWHVYECIGGAWQNVDTFCDPVSCF